MLVGAARVTALHRRLHRDARQDALTGLGNRHRLAEDLAAMQARAQRYGHRWCVALADIDNFKGYNDGTGHLAGDALLRRISATLAATVAAATRSTATAARSSSSCCPSRRSRRPRSPPSGCAGRRGPRACRTPTGAS